MLGTNTLASALIAGSALLVTSATSAAANSVEVKAEVTLSTESAVSESIKANSTEAEPKPSKLRRARGSDLNREVVHIAQRIVKENHRKPFGTEVPFEVGGKKYVGRMEQHFHPVGGQLRPWGYHPGCSILVVVE